MEEQNRTVFYIMIAVIFAMIAGMGYMFYQKYNEIHDRQERIERKMKKEEKEVKKAKDNININLNKTIKVPDVTGMTYEEAKKELEKAGFEVGEVVIESGDLDGRVSKTIPAAGSTRQYGTVVFIYISE